MDLEKCKQRKEEVQTLRQSGEFLGSIVAARDMILGVPIENAIQVKSEVVKNFNSPTFCRRDLIRIAEETREVCIHMLDTVTPHSKDSHIAFELRRLTLLSRIVECGIAEGNLAVETVDFLMGKFNLCIDNMEIVKELVHF